MAACIASAEIAPPFGAGTDATLGRVGSGLGRYMCIRLYHCIIHNSYVV